MSLIDIESLWESQVTTNDYPADPSADTVPASGWDAAEYAPFGHIGTILVPYPPNTTDWPVTEGRWFRRNVVTDGKADVLVEGRIDNTAFIYVDGVYIGGANLEFADRVAHYYMVIPKEILTSGTHEIAVHCLNFENGGSGDSTYFYIKMDYLPALLTFQPEAPVSETLSWVTDVQISKDGTEDRQKIVLSPRQAFEYTYPLTAARKALGLNMTRDALAKEWLVPVWSQARYVGAVAADLTELTGLNLAYGEFRDVSLVLLWESPDSWQILGIDSLDTSSFTFAGFTTEMATAWLMPLRFAYLQNDAVRGFNGYEATIKMTFSVRDNAELTVGAPTQYLSDDLYTEPGLFDSGMDTEDLRSDRDLFDPGLGLVTFYDNWTYNRRARTHRVVCEDQAEAWALRQYLHRRAGRYKQFWQPSFEHDVRVTSTGTITTELRIEDDGYLQRAADRTHIAVQIGSTWYVRAITAAADVGSDRTSLTLSSALNVAASAIKRVCWLGLHRLDTDRVEIRYLGNGVSTSEFRIVEITP